MLIHKAYKAFRELSDLKSRIDISPMSNVQNLSASVVNIVNNMIDADSNPPAISSDKLFTIIWMRILRQ